MEMHTTSAKAPSPVCSLIASKLRERIYAPHGLLGTRDRHRWWILQPMAA
jgi:hypothetical protein